MTIVGAAAAGGSHEEPAVSPAMRAATAALQKAEHGLRAAQTKLAMRKAQHLSAEVS